MVVRTSGALGRRRETAVSMPDQTAWPEAARLDAPRFIGSEIYRRSRYGTGHPLAIPRVSTVIDLSRALGWLPDDQYLDSPVARPSSSPAFTTATTSPPWSRPSGPEPPARPAPALQHRLQRQPGVPGDLSPAGHRLRRLPARRRADPRRRDGLQSGRRHPSRPARPGERLLLLQRPGAGHPAAARRGRGPRLLSRRRRPSRRRGPGGLRGRSQGPDRFNPRVRPLAHDDSWRADGDKAGIGCRRDCVRPGRRRGPQPAGAARLPRRRDGLLVDEAVLPLAHAFAPEAVVLQGGADALDDDPQSKLALSNRALWRVVAAVRHLAPRLLVLGGGGYNPWSVARCWTGVWGRAERPRDAGAAAAEAEAVLRALHWRHSKGRNPPEHWFTSLPIRPAGRSAPRCGAWRPGLAGLRLRLTTVGRHARDVLFALVLGLAGDGPAAARQRSRWPLSSAIWRSCTRRGRGAGVRYRARRQPQQQAQGLMYRQSLAADAGMLFLYRPAREVSMWMKNTLIPLDMLFIAEDGIRREGRRADGALVARDDFLWRAGARRARDQWGDGAVVWDSAGRSGRPPGFRRATLGLTCVGGKVGCSGLRFQGELSLEHAPAFAGRHQARHALGRGDDDRPGLAVAGRKDLHEPAVVGNAHGDRRFGILSREQFQHGVPGIALRRGEPPRRTPGRERSRTPGTSTLRAFEQGSFPAAVGPNAGFPAAWASLTGS